MNDERYGTDGYMQNDDSVNKAENTENIKKDTEITYRIEDVYKTEILEESKNVENIVEETIETPVYENRQAEYRETIEMPKTEETPVYENRQAEYRETIEVPKTEETPVYENRQEKIIEEPAYEGQYKKIAEGQEIDRISMLDDEEKRIREMKIKKLEELKKLQIEEIRAKREKRKQNAKSFSKGAFKTAVCLACFFTLGLGASIGGKFTTAYMENKGRTDFTFDSSIDGTPVSMGDDFIIKTSASSIFEEVGDSVVNISTKISSGFFKQSIQNASSGSGIIYKVDGDKVYIITNNHVIEDAEYVTVSVTGDEQVNAKLVGTDPRSDLAVLSVSKKDMNSAGIKNIKVAKFADSDTVEVGDFVFPIGNALGRGKTMTNGMISAQNKEINIDGKNLTVLQTDAAINPGNSGGALMNTKGEVVGINTAKLSSSAIEGIGYAIPTNIAVDVVDQIIEHGYVQRPYFGIIGKTITDETKEIYGINIDGVFVINVEKDSNADKAGLKQGDIITNFNGNDISTLEDLADAIKGCSPNETVSFEIVRNGGEEMRLSVKLVPSTVEF